MDIKTLHYVIAAVLYLVFFLYIAFHFSRDTAALRKMGQSKDEASFNVRMDFKEGFLKPGHKLFPAALFLGAIIIYWFAVTIMYQ